MIMERFVLSTILFIFLYVEQGGDCRIVSEDPLVAAKNSLPKEEQVFLLKYHLSLAINRQTRPADLNVTLKIPEDVEVPAKLLDKFKSMGIPISSSRKLLSWTEEKYNLNLNEAIRLVKSGVVCSSTSNICVALPGIADQCCPW